MFGSEALEVGIGMALLFLFMALIATAAQEGLEALLKRRARDLERGVSELLADPETLDKFYKHPLVASLYKGTYQSGKRELPSYIPTKNAVYAIIDLVSGASASNNPVSVAGLRAHLASVKDPTSAQRALLALINTADHDLETFRNSVEDWYDGTMDRVSGWYKRRSQRFQFLFGLIFAVALNVDAITVASHLFSNKPLRDSVVKAAEEYGNADTGRTGGGLPPNADTPPGQGAGGSLPAPPGNVGPNVAALDGTPSERLKQLRSDLGAIGYPLGWKSVGPDKQEWLKDHSWIAQMPDLLAVPAWRLANTWPAPQACSPEAARPCSMTLGKWAQAVVGWFITALAVMLGAPFWFDVLNKFMVIRSTVKPKEKSPEEGSEDRQARSMSPVRVVVAAEPAGHAGKGG